jgi:hypothetical protein
MEIPEIHPQNVDRPWKQASFCCEPQSSKPPTDARPSFLRHETEANEASPDVPAIFDARKQWPKCNSIGLIRNQAGIGGDTLDHVGSILWGVP